MDRFTALLFSHQTLATGVTEDARSDSESADDEMEEEERKQR